MAYLSAYNDTKQIPEHIEIYPTCDYRIKCQDELQETIHCHKNVLCNNSPVFKDIITTESQNENIYTTSVSSHTMKKLIQYMYTSLLEKDSMDLAMLDAAVKYKIIPLLALFKDDLESALSIENVVEVLLGAHRQNVEFYKRCATDFI